MYLTLTQFSETVWPLILCSSLCYLPGGCQSVSKQGLAISTSHHPWLCADSSLTRSKLGLWLCQSANSQQTYKVVRLSRLAPWGRLQPPSKDHCHLQDCGSGGSCCICRYGTSISLLFVWSSETLPVCFFCILAHFLNAPHVIHCQEIMNNVKWMDE